MKKTLVLGLAIGLVSLAGIAVAGPSAVRPLPTPGYTGQKNTGAAGIVGSSHDLSNVGGTNAGSTSNSFAGGDGTVAGAADVQARICVYCHHPHNAYSAGTQTGGRTGQVAAIGSYSPLWNREMSTTTFLGYDNGILMGGATIAGSDKRHALNAADAGSADTTHGTTIAGVSLLCMSCHDGVVAMSAYSVKTGSTQNAGSGGSAITSSAAFKGNMNNHHPMGFKYTVVQAADAEIAAPTTVMVPGSSTTIGDLLYGADKTMECVTCHDVHNTANQTGAERFLWRSDNQSNFCLTCHLK